MVHKFREQQTVRHDENGRSSLTECTTTFVSFQPAESVQKEKKNK